MTNHNTVALCGFYAEMEKKSMSLSDNTVVLTGGILGVVIVSQSVIIVILLFLWKRKAQSKYKYASVEYEYIH